jgi:hypothetical protein
MQKLEALYPGKKQEMLRKLRDYHNKYNLQGKKVSTSLLPTLTEQDQATEQQSMGVSMARHSLRSTSEPKHSQISQPTPPVESQYLTLEKIQGMKSIEELYYNDIRANQEDENNSFYTVNP